MPIKMTEVDFGNRVKTMTDSGIIVSTLMNGDRCADVVFRAMSYYQSTTSLIRECEDGILRCADRIRELRAADPDRYTEQRCELCDEPTGSTGADTNDRTP